MLIGLIKPILYQMISFTYCFRFGGFIDSIFRIFPSLYVVQGSDFILLGFRSILMDLLMVHTSRLVLGWQRRRCHKMIFFITSSVIKTLPFLRTSIRAFLR